MTSVFISYSHDDTPFASKLANDLLDKGYDVWLDTLNLPGGSTWDRDIMQAIDDCEVYLLVWTANIEGSSYSRKEKDRALAEDKKIIPIYRSGDKGRMWDDIKQFQWVDFDEQAHYDTAFKELLDGMPLSGDQKPPPDLKDLIRQGDSTFRGVSRLWRSKLRYSNDEGNIIALLIERSVHGVQSYLVGYENARLERPDELQIFLNFSGPVAEDRFEDYLHYVAALDLPLWTVLVRGPIVSTSRGLMYSLPEDRAVWERAVSLIRTGSSSVSTAATPFHLYMNAPVALGSAYCASEHFRRGVHIYHVNFTAKRAKDRYFKVFEM